MAVNLFRKRIVSLDNGILKCITFAQSLSARRLTMISKQTPTFIATACVSSSSIGQNFVPHIFAASFSTSAVRDNDKESLEASINKNISTIKDGRFEESLTNPEELKHFKKPSIIPCEPEEKTDLAEFDSLALPHPIWTENDVYKVEITHKKPKGFLDHMALFNVKLIRFSFDTLSGYNWKSKRDENVWLNRICFLETVAGVPGMVAAMARHLLSLRRLRRDHGWIHTLLEEAENERMHLMVSLQLKKPSSFFCAAVVITQGIFVNFFFMTYLIAPRYCHRFVGYLEEEAVTTYTKCLHEIDSGPMEIWKTKPAPDVAIKYWRLAPTATMRDVILAIRADEAHHRLVNHTLGSLKPDDFNPYKPGKH